MQRSLAVRAFVNLTRAFVGLRISKESFPVGVKKRRAAKQRWAEMQEYIANLGAKEVDDKSNGKDTIFSPFFE